MARLILLNGPPASGKSTLAARWVLARPLALNLDIDTVRGLLGAWIEQPHDAGLAARRLAIAMATTHLVAGHDVIVPQFLTRDTLIDQLHAVADETGARFIEIALIVSRVQTTQAFTARSRAPENQQHIDASDSVENADRIDAVGVMHDQYIHFLRTRHNAHQIPVVHGDIASSLQLIEQAIEPGA